ncbi:choline transport protein [Apiospora hydei]|uniref:Choline transport protein n=1 Tax=Apiospora hydei TaxID=1337664 RepID=A0ABR1V214_9PEZI
MEGPKPQRGGRTLSLGIVVDAALAAISIGSTAAFDAIISLPAIVTYLSYGTPVAFVLLRRLRGQPLGKPACCT